MKLFGRNYWFNFMCWVHLDLRYFQQIDVSTKVFWVGKWSILKVFTSLDGKGWQPKDKDPSCHFLSPHKGWGAPTKVTELHVVSQEDLQIWEIHWTVHYICEGIYRFQPFEWCWVTTSDIQKTVLKLPTFNCSRDTGGGLQVRASFNELGRPNADVAMGVDTRQELDLRVGPVAYVLDLIGRYGREMLNTSKHRIWESLARLIINTIFNRLLEIFPKSVVVDVCVCVKLMEILRPSISRFFTEISSTQQPMFFHQMPLVMQELPSADFWPDICGIPHWRILVEKVWNHPSLMDLVKHLPWAFAWRDRRDEGMVIANRCIL